MALCAKTIKKLAKSAKLAGKPKNLAPGERVTHSGHDAQIDKDWVMTRRTSDEAAKVVAGMPEDNRPLTREKGQFKGPVSKLTQSEDTLAEDPQSYAKMPPKGRPTAAIIRDDEIDSRMPAEPRRTRDPVQFLNQEEINRPGPSGLQRLMGHLKSRLTKSMNSPSKYASRQNLEQALKDHNIGAGGKEYQEDELRDLIMRKRTAQAEAQADADWARYAHDNEPTEPTEKSDKPFHGYNKKRHAPTGGLNEKFREKYNRETGSNLKAPVTEKNPTGKKAARKRSFCARMSGVKGPTSKDGKLTPKGAALKRWRCSKSEPNSELEKTDKSGVIRYNAEKGVNKPTVRGSGTSEQGYTVRGGLAIYGDKMRHRSPTPSGEISYDRDLARTKAKKVLADLKDQPKPNLPKAEYDPEIKGVHQRSAIPHRSHPKHEDKNSSSAGDDVRHEKHHPNRSKALQGAKTAHRAVLRDLKAQTKPNLPKAELEKTESLEKGKNKREQRAKVFGRAAVPTEGSAMRDKWMSHIKDYAEARYKMPVERAPGKPNASGKIIDKPELSSDSIQHIGNPASLLHELAHIENQQNPNMSADEFQAWMDKRWGAINKEHGYKQQAREAEEYEAHGSENKMRRQLGLPAHPRPTREMKPERLFAVDRPDKQIARDVPHKDGTRRITGLSSNLDARRQAFEQRQAGEQSYYPKQGWVDQSNPDALINRRARGDKEGATRLLRALRSSRAKKRNTA